MYALLRQIFPLVFFILWIGVGIILFFRARAKQVAYLKRFPPVEGVPLYMVGGGNPFGAQARAIWRAMRRQPDPELERLRREVWRRFRLYPIWIFGFPLLTGGVVALLIVSGLAH
jgi:hypothetical protein